MLWGVSKPSVWDWGCIIGLSCPEASRFLEQLLLSPDLQSVVSHGGTIQPLICASQSNKVPLKVNKAPPLRDTFSLFSSSGEL